jgi:hypothetical protein
LEQHHQDEEQGNQRQQHEQEIAQHGYHLVKDPRVSQVVLKVSRPTQSKVERGETFRLARSTQRQERRSGRGGDLAADPP